MWYGRKPPRAGLHVLRVVIVKHERLNAHFYVYPLQCVHKSLGEKRPGVVNRKYIVPHHDDARPNRASIIQEGVIELIWFILPTSPYSADLPPTDYYICRTLQNALTKKSFSKENEIQGLSKKLFASKRTEIWSKDIGKLHNNWQQVITNNGGYIIE